MPERAGSQVHIDQANISSGEDAPVVEKRPDPELTVTPKQIARLLEGKDLFIREPGEGGITVHLSPGVTEMSDELRAAIVELATRIREEADRA